MNPGVRDIAFAKRLEGLMSKAGMTQSQLAAEMYGRARNDKGALVARKRDRVSVWLSGKNYPDQENLPLLARALGVEVTDLAPEAGRVSDQRTSGGGPAAGELREGGARSAVANPSRAANWSFTQPADGSDLVFVQIAQYLPPAIAHEIHGLLLKAKQTQIP